MKILIVDDEELARQRIIDLLSDIDIEYLTIQAKNGLQALEVTEKEKPDIVLMDIRMPGMDGLESATHMSVFSPTPAVIFITAFEEHAVKAFEANAIDYLLKPVRLERLRQALNKAKMISHSRINHFQEMQEFKSSRSHLSVSSQGKILLIPLDKISCFKADQKYVTAYWDDQQTLTDESLKNLEQEFSDTFIRIHRNALISTSYINALEKTKDGAYIIKLNNLDEEFTVSRRHIPEIKKKLKNI
ncbi:MAG: two-component system response regulator AlgR [Gammaproteobacteria bacterium]|jgi:two-component system response regulator AlgR